MFRFPNQFRQWTGVLALSATVGVAGGCAPTISTQQEAQLGAQYAAQLSRELPLVRDQAINRYISQLGNSIASQVDRRGLNYRFFVVNSDVVNAFAVPGGYVYVNRGLIERADNMSELAGVLGHEIAHVVERHGVEQMAKAQQANTLTSVLYGVLLQRPPSTVEQVGLQLGGGALFAGYSRDAEREADADAVQYLVQRGIDPRGIPSFFQELLRERQRSPGALDQWFATHPLTEERIENTRAAIQRIPAARLQALTTDTPTFREFQARVRRLPAAPAPRQR